MISYEPQAPPGLSTFCGRHDYTRDCQRRWFGRSRTDLGVRCRYSGTDLPDCDQPVIASLPAPAVDVKDDLPEAKPLEARPIKAASLAQMVAAQPQPTELPRELHCLVGAIYFEAKSRSLTGQLAVGPGDRGPLEIRPLPNSYCGVVFQPSQFSFVRGRAMPGISKGSKQWKNAVAIAQIAHSGAWSNPVEGALFFHAAYVSPGWKLRRVGRVENHVFYR